LFNVAVTAAGTPPDPAAAADDVDVDADAGGGDDDDDPPPLLHPAAITSTPSPASHTPPRDDIFTLRTSWLAHPDHPSLEPPQPACPISTAHHNHKSHLSPLA
jgi:hypothetical protein